MAILMPPADTASPHHLPGSCRSLRRSPHSSASQAQAMDTGAHGSHRRRMHGIRQPSAMGAWRRARSWYRRRVLRLRSSNRSQGWLLRYQPLPPRSRLCSQALALGWVQRSSAARGPQDLHPQDPQGHQRAARTQPRQHFSSRTRLAPQSRARSCPLCSRHSSSLVRMQCRAGRACSHNPSTWRCHRTPTCSQPAPPPLPHVHLLALQPPC